MNLLQSTFIEVHKLSLNTGQIPDVPKNPRFIRDERFKKLVKSLEDNPEMLSARELLVYNYDGELIVIGGNMRLRAAKELGFKQLPCKVLDDLTPEQIRAFVIKDNVSFGSDDFESLANEWDSIELEEWGLEVPNFDEELSNIQDYEGLDDLSKLDKFIGAEIKRMFLVYDSATFENVVNWFIKLQNKFNVEDNNQVILKLIENENI